MKWPFLLGCLLVVVLAGISSLVVNATTTPGPSTTTTMTAPANEESYQWLRIVPGQRLGSDRVMRPLRVGTVLTTAQLRDGTLTPRSLVGDDGFALFDTNNTQYPVATTDHAGHWTIAGPPFADGGADGSAGANTVAAYSASTALAVGDAYLYSTDSGGRVWYLTNFVEWLANEATRPPATSPDPDLTFTAGPYDPTTRTLSVTVRQYTSVEHVARRLLSAATYRSRNGGRSWRLAAVAPIA